MFCDTRTIINHVKNYINNTKSAVTLHDGNEDPECQFHGNHLHIMTETEYKIHNTYIYKKMVRNLAPYAVEIKSEQIRSPMLFGKYMVKPPRLVPGNQQRPDTGKHTGNHTGSQGNRKEGHKDPNPVPTD